MKKFTEEQIQKVRDAFVSILKDANEVDPNDENAIGTWFIPLERIGNNNWAIVIAWQDGFGFPDEYALCAKIAYQPKNSIMQCDYDIDWLMPYRESDGEVYETEIGGIEEKFIDEMISDYVNVIRRGALLADLIGDGVEYTADEYDFMCDLAVLGFTLEDFKFCTVDKYEWAYEFCKTHACGFPDEPNNEN